MLSLVFSPVAYGTQRVVSLRTSSPRVPSVAASGAPAKVQFVDRDGDTVAFFVEDSRLKMLVSGELYFEEVETLEYATTDGSLRQNMGEGLCQLQDTRERPAQAAALEALADAAGVEWLEFDTLPELVYEDGEEEEEEEIVFPPEIDKILDIDDELRSQRPEAAILWRELKKIYPTEEAALKAVQKNTAIIMPYMTMPGFIQGSWKVLNEMMSEEEALQVVTANPGVLGCNPAGLKKSDADTVKRAAGFVDGLETLLDSTVRKLFKGD